ncbi:fungal-specific transcription factor domain-containing protein [Thelephora terrestris]|uniref:Fungal-specific transcription factor domain-containing protein n=1 Tax=Thelephora terrestris TaxID=56493 RepID=A0A9P6HJ16_9AGAM|nr:fungal-specific transcription factor domain-containing protein [Thelephora terrestris]
MESPEDSGPMQEQQQPQQSAKSFSQSSHVRSRITVVCAECKRLKLRCDRRAPCGSCLKRDTLDRCKYSQAAAEKIDLQSVHNRVVTLEAQMAVLNSTATQKPNALSLDRTLLAVGNSGSSLAVSLDDIASIWLSHLNIVPSIKLKLETGEADLPDGDLPLSTAFPPISLFLSSSSALESPAVTTQLVARLPQSKQAQQQFLDSVDDVLALHPSFNFQDFQARVQNLFLWASEAETYEFATGNSTFPSTSTSRDSSPSRPSLSFFAAASVAFALGSLVRRTNVSHLAFHGGGNSASSNAYPLVDEDPSASPAALFALSEQALNVFERSNNYDLDYMVAMILQVIYLLHDGRPRLSHTILPLVGKMVNIARIMGLNLDPDEFPGTYPLFEAETRRRVWWDVFYYDLFVSDCMGHQPLIPDNPFTTKLPTDVDESRFSPFSTTIPHPSDSCKTDNTYFGLKCRLAQLVKSLKRRSCRDPLGLEVNDVLLDESVELEGKVNQFVSDLPTDYQFDLNSPPSLEDEDSHTSLILARSCELQIIANRMIISLYIPHLKAHSVNPLHQASFAVMNAAHKIIQCMKIWQSRRNCLGVRERGRWGSFGVYYDYGRILFDAAVVCASIAIDGTGGAFAACFKEDLDSALEALKEMEFKRPTRPGFSGIGMRSGVEANATEPVAIIEMLKQKVEASQVAGIKRKRQDGEVDAFQPGFRIPFVGAAVSFSIPDPTPTSLVPPEFTSDISPVPPHDQSEPVSRVKLEDRLDDPILDKKRQRQKPPKDVREVPSDKRKLAKAKPKDKEKDKETKYPSYGIRIRPGLPPPYARGRGSAPQTSKVPKQTPAPADGSNGQPNTPYIEIPPTLPHNSSLPSPLLMPQHLEPQLYDGSFPSTPIHEHEQPMVDENRRRSVTTPFDTGPDARIQPRGRYNNGAYSSTSAFFDHPSYPASQVTTPTSTEPTPPFSVPTPVQAGTGQFRGASQPHQDYFPQTFRDPSIGSNGYENMSYNGASQPSYPMNSMEHGPSSAVTDASYIVSDEKVPLSVFMPNEPHMLSGSSQQSSQDLHMTRRQDWHPPTQNPGDQQYWF